MAHYFKLGGFGMIPTTVLGLIALLFGLWAAVRPTPARGVALRHLVHLTLLSAVIGMATSMTVVGLHLDDPAFLKARGIAGDALTTVGFVGTGEATVNLWWGGVLAFLGTLCRLAVDVKLTRAGLR
jgi:hypothetical protein